MAGDAAAQPAAIVSRPKLSKSQARAIGFVVGQDVSYLWGPPGTGKTSSVAELVHELLARGERVLVTAHTNTATDTALLKVLQAGSLPANGAVRVGFHSEQLRPFSVGLDDAVERVLRREHPDVVQGIEEVCSLAVRLLTRAPRALIAPRTPLARRLRVVADLMDRPGLRDDQDLRAQVKVLLSAIEEVESSVVGRASVVATTLTRLFTSRLLKRFQTDTVIVDEASIASLTHCFVAACFARKRAVAAGDFMQLPAIVQANQPAARSWLGTHVFRSARCDDPRREHPLRVMLDEQWRMQPGISSVVSRVFYASKLRDAPAVIARARPGASALLLDTGRLSARSERPAAGSKRNGVHAELIADLVVRAKSKDIAVITPYRAQVRLIRDAIRRRSPELLESGAAEVFTVHRFQGRDKDLVVFDTVEAAGTDAPFLNDVRNPEAPNLINVALSRARERLVVVADVGHINRVLSRQSVIARVFAELRSNGGLELEAGDERDAAGIEAFLRDAT